MNLGYLMIPRTSTNGAPLRDTGRAEMARTLGMSEFYAIAPKDPAEDTQTCTTSPEHANALCTLPELPEHPMPKVVAIDGKRQSACETGAANNLAVPSVTPEQVTTNVLLHQATFSVSWLNKSDLARHWAAHVSGSTHAGLRARPEAWRVARTILVCNDTARAEAAVKSEDGPCRAYYRKMAEPGTDLDSLLDDCVLYGSLDTVQDRLREILDATGPFGTLTLVDHAWHDENLAQQSLVSLTSALAPMKLRSRTAT